MKILVTGGCGFIGSHLVDRLVRDGHQVTVLDNLATGRRENLQSAPGAELVEVDIADHDRIASHFRGIEVVYHVAGLADIVPSIVDPLPYFRANVDGTVSVIEAARKAEVGRVVYAASSSCYGIPDTYPTPETTPARPLHPYALTKWMGEQAMLHWARVYGIACISLRLFNVYGPRSRTTGAYGAVFGVFLAQRANKVPLTVVGDGRQTRDFVFVSDVVEAFRRAGTSAISSEILNVGSGAPQSVARLAELIGGPITYLPKRPGEPDVTHADISKAHRQLEWAPKVSFEEGVGVMTGRLHEWREAPVWTPDRIAEATREWFKRLGSQ